MNLSEKQKASVVKKSVKNSVKKSNEPSLDWLETLGKQPLASSRF